MWRRPFAMALDTLHVANGKWKFFSHGHVVPLLDVTVDPDGSKSVTALHSHYESLTARSSENGPAEDVSPARPQPATDNDAPS